MAYSMTPRRDPEVRARLLPDWAHDAKAGEVCEGLGCAFPVDGVLDALDHGADRPPPIGHPIDDCIAFVRRNQRANHHYRASRPRGGCRSPSFTLGPSGVTIGSSEAAARFAAGPTRQPFPGPLAATCTVCRLIGPAVLRQQVARDVAGVVGAAGQVVLVLVGAANVVDQWQDLDGDPVGVVAGR